MKTAHLLTAFLAFAFLSAAAFADYDFNYSLNTTDASQWEVAKVNVSNYSNPEKDNRGEKYTKTGTLWQDSYLGNIGNWSAAVGGERYTWKDDNEWVAEATTNKDMKVENGFYAFKYAFTRDNEDDLSVGGLLNLTLGGDDYIAAIYANGELLYSDKIVKGTGVTSDSNGVGDGSTFTNWLTLDPFEFDVAFNEDGGLELVFIVHNTNAAGSDSANPMGLYVSGTLYTSVEVLPPHTEEAPTLTPEPGTMLIFGLGIAGMGLANARRRKK